MAIKELPFGTVPNIFEDDLYLNKDQDTQSLELVFGTAEDTTNTLESLGCQADVLKKYNQDHKHIFSGMSPLYSCRSVIHGLIRCSGI